MDQHTSARPTRKSIAAPVALVIFILLALVCGGAAAVPQRPVWGGAQGDATITGRVRGLERATRVDGRTIEVVDIDSGTRQRALTNAAGGFAFTLRPGRYRLQISLRDGESIVKQPDGIRLDPSAHADVVLAVVKSPRARPHVHQADLGLGAPIA
jgi:hypothetical protein